jgi:hypothetical protein
MEIGLSIVQIFQLERSVAPRAMHYFTLDVLNPESREK